MRCYCFYWCFNSDRKIYQSLMLCASITSVILAQGTGVVCWTQAEIIRAAERCVAMETSPSIITLQGTLFLSAH